MVTYEQATQLPRAAQRTPARLYQRMPDSTREVLLENLLDQAYLAAIIDVSNEEIERLKEEQKKVHA
jgi:hypothetical protein